MYRILAKCSTCGNEEAYDMNEKEYNIIIKC